MRSATATTSSILMTAPLSLAGHGVLLLGVLWTLAPHQPPAPALRTVNVDLVTPEEFAAALAPAPGPAPEFETPVPVPPAPPLAPQPPPPSDGMVEATDFFAAGILADPANLEVRRNFPLLASSEQVVQLCNMEALEQLRLAGRLPVPDALVGYAFDGFSVRGTTLDATGGAFRSGGAWFHLRYRCTVAADVSAVSAFEYAIGDPIPESQWEEHFLNSDDDWLN